MKKAIIEWKITLDYPIHDGDEECLRFYLEESHCFENILDYLIEQREEGKCIMCSISTLKILGFKDE